MGSDLYTEKDKNIRKTYLLMTTFIAFVFFLGWIFSYTLDNYAIFLFAFIFASIMNISAFWFSDKIVLAMSNAKELTTETPEGREINRLVENLSITAGLPKPRVYIINDTAMNAFATGRDPKHGVIALTTGIIARLEKNELEGVIAHELAHIGNRDTLIQTVAVILVGFVALMSDWFLRFSLFGNRRRNNDSKSQLDLILTVVAIVLAILAPIFVQLLQLAISRKREFLADASGALLTRYPDGLASALQKISQDTEPLEVANRATAHLFIANPFKGKNISKLFSTHPPIEDRIQALMNTKIE